MNSRYRPYLLAALVSVLTFAVFLPVLQSHFVNWDDDIYVYDNYGIRSLNAAFLKKAFLGFHESYWIPFTWTSHALDYRLWGLNPAGHHLSSIVLHALNTFLVVILAVMLLEGRRRPMVSLQLAPHGSPLTPDASRFSLLAAGATGLLFGIHPLHVESVAWISERKDVLYAAFYLCSIMAYTKYALCRGRDREAVTLSAALRHRQYLLACLLFLCSLMSKPMAVTLPVVLIILDWYPFGRASSLKDLRLLLIEKIPFICGSLVVSLVAVMSHRAVEDMPPLEAISVPTRLLVACKALILYLWKALLPISLVPVYPHPMTASLRSADYLLPVALVIMVTSASIVLGRRNRLWLSLWAYYVVTLLPVIGIVQTGSQAMADRFTYIPGLAPFLLLGLAISTAWERTYSSVKWGAMARTSAAAFAVLLYAGAAFLTVKQIRIWKDSVTLWSYVIREEPAGFPLAYVNRGIAYFDSGDPDSALRDLNTALEVDEARAAAYLSYTNRGRIYRELGRMTEALEDLNTAISLKPGHADAFANRGLLYQAAGRPDEAIADFTEAIKLDPEQYNVFVWRGLTFKGIGRFEAAVEDYTRAISLNPSGVEAYNNRGVAYRYLNQPDMAIADYNKAISLNPSFYLAYCNRAILLGGSGRPDEAVRDYTLAISLKPDLTKAYLERGALQQQAGRHDLAMSDFLKACELGSKEGCAAARTYGRNGTDK